MNSLKFIKLNMLYDKVGHFYNGNFHYSVWYKNTKHKYETEVHISNTNAAFHVLLGLGGYCYDSMNITIQNIKCVDLYKSFYGRYELIIEFNKSPSDKVVVTGWSRKSILSKLQRMGK